VKIKFQIDVIGLYLGFPECCIKSFRVRGACDIEPGFPLEGTGYVPCPKCIDKSEDELKAAIEKNRLCPYPFPEEGGMSDLYERARAALIDSGMWAPAD
jgi:hypothetical protein